MVDLNALCYLGVSMGLQICCVWLYPPRIVYEITETTALPPRRHALTVCGSKRWPVLRSARHDRTLLIQGAGLELGAKGVGVCRWCKMYFKINNILTFPCYPQPLYHPLPIHPKPPNLQGTV